MDTGAPFSISTHLQNEFVFDVISTGNIIDSDHLRTKVNWVQVDTVHIGSISFINQTAFIGDFQVNPILNCLGIDGIVGSNLLRHSNWTIDQAQKVLSLSSTVEKRAKQDIHVIPFKTDHQYNIYVDVNLGEATVSNVLVDFGSNGPVSLSKDIFASILDNNNVQTFNELGVLQSGLIGKTVPLRRKIVISDVVSFDSLPLGKTMLRTGPTVSIGNNVLSRFQIIIDWNNQNLYILESKNPSHFYVSAGFKLGYAPDYGIYVQSVLQHSNAYKEGVRPYKKVLKVDGLDFANGDDFCDYVDHKYGDNIYLQLLDSLGQKKDYHFEMMVFD